MTTLKVIFTLTTIFLIGTCTGNGTDYDTDIETNEDLLDLLRNVIETQQGQGPATFLDPSTFVVPNSPNTTSPNTTSPNTTSPNTTSPTTLLKGEVNTSIKSCPNGQVCVEEYLCDNNDKVITDADITVINVRFLNENEETPCKFLQKCCSLEDTVSEPIVNPTSIATGCGYRNSRGAGFRIESPENNESEFGEFPWMLAVMRGRNEADPLREIYQCGGSLIHPQVALTAAHCVQKRPPSAFAVRAGEWETNTKTELFPDQNRNVVDIIIHPNYNNRKLFNDVALLFLESPFELAPHINTICLPPADFIFDFSKCVATGWGKDQYHNGVYQNILKKIELPVVPSYVCQDNLRKTILGSYYKLDESFMCAGGERGKDTCEGDGGSPLACPIENDFDRYYQAGIVAWGIGCGKENVPGIYVNLSKFRKWIDGELQKKQIKISDYVPKQ